MIECAALVGVKLFACLAANEACLPRRLQDEIPAIRHDLAAIGEQESGLRPWALRDETTAESLFLLTREALAAEIQRRLAAGHVLGVGPWQITGEANWRRHGLTSIEALTDPCQNLRAAAEHYLDNLRSAAAQLYNSGRIDGAPGYASQVANRRQRLAPLLDAPALPSPPISDPAEPRQRATAFRRADGRSSAFSRPSHEAGGRGLGSQSLAETTP